MYNIPITTLRHVSVDAFRKALAKAQFESFFNQLFGKQTGLLDFEQLTPQLNPNRTYLGVQEVPIHKITGSLGRVQDFDNRFRPLKENLMERWVGVAGMLRLEGWPPIMLYKGEDQYYLVDGHHRTSVACWEGYKFIEAEVWEFTKTKKAEPQKSFVPPALHIAQTRKKASNPCCVQEKPGLAS
jgi:hypothetical protein